jgi:hypothetical protein
MSSQNPEEILESGEEKRRKRDIVKTDKDVWKKRSNREIHNPDGGGKRLIHLFKMPAARCYRLVFNAFRWIVLPMR